MFSTRAGIRPEQNKIMSAKKLTDALSRAASAVKAIRKSHALAAEMDAGFDAGEFSGPAHGDMEQAETVAAVARFGFTPAEFNRELAVRTAARFAYFSGLQVDAGDQYENDSVYGKGANK